LKRYKTKKKKKPFLTCDQIWLIPLVDDCQFGYITQLNKNKSKTKLGTQTRLKSMKIEGKKGR